MDCVCEGVDRGTVCVRGVDRGTVCVVPIPHTHSPSHPLPHTRTHSTSIPDTALLMHPRQRLGAWTNPRTQRLHLMWEDDHFGSDDHFGPAWMSPGRSLYSHDIVPECPWPSSSLV